jgi:RNA polymerase sigma factor (sigma-70 family)
VVRALAGLSRQQRAIVVLRYVEDRSVADTADLLDCSLQTVRVQSSRALARLRSDPHIDTIRTGEHPADAAGGPR